MIKHSTQECATLWGDSITKDEPKTKLTNNKHKWVNPSVGGKYGGWVVYKGWIEINIPPYTTCKNISLKKIEFNKLMCICKEEEKHSRWFEKQCVSMSVKTTWDNKNSTQLRKMKLLWQAPQQWSQVNVHT